MGPSNIGELARNRRIVYYIREYKKLDDIGLNLDDNIMKWTLMSLIKNNGDIGKAAKELKTPICHISLMRTLGRREKRKKEND